MKRNTVVLMVVLFLLPMVSVGGPWQEGGPTTVAHRGTTVLAEENTMVAYALAADSGAHVFECDPKLTKDGVYVIMHDETVDRTTDGKGRVADLTLAEVKALRTKSGQHVPTLAEALNFALSRGMSVYLDVKKHPADGGKILLRTIAEAGMTNRVIVGCYGLRTAASIHRLSPSTSICVSWPYPASLGVARLVGAEAVGTLTELASPTMIRFAHLYGLKVITMPINDAEEMKKMREVGLDGLQSDDPRLLTPYQRREKEE